MRPTLKGLNITVFSYSRS